MKVMRYDFTRNAKRNLSKDNKISQRFARESEEEGEEEEEEELCRSKPLLDKHNCRWNSCEFTLEDKTSDSEEKSGKEYIQLKDWRLHDCDKARQASKSLGNFLAFNSQQQQQQKQQQYQMDTDHYERRYDKNNKKYCKNSDSEKFVNINNGSNGSNKAEKQKQSYYHHNTKGNLPKREQQIEVKGNEEKEREFDLEVSYKENYRRQPSNLLSCKSNTTCSKSLVKSLLPKNNNNNNQKRIARIGANRARRRRAILSSSVLKAPEIITTANLSLSSPVLISHHEYDEEHKQQQQPASRPQDASEVDETKAADPNNLPSVTTQCLALSGSNNNDSFMGQLDDGQPVVAEFNDVHACETKKETFIIKDNRNGHATGETNRLHCCFVDVASSFETSQACSNNKKMDQQQQQSHVSSRLQGCSTNERSSWSCSCCNNSRSSNGSNSNAVVATSDGEFSSICLSCDAYYIDYDNDKSNTTSARQPIEVNGNVEQGYGQKRNTPQSPLTDNEEKQVSFDDRGVGGHGKLSKLSFALEDDNDHDDDYDGPNELDFSTSIKPLSCLNSKSNATATTRPIVDSLLTIQDQQQKETLFHYQPKQSSFKEEEIEVERNFDLTNECFQHNQIANNIKGNTKQKVAIEKLENSNDITKNTAAAAAAATTTTTTNATTTTNSNKLMLVDLNNFPTKFMNYNSWPKVLLQPGNSATYKVVKQQEVSTVSGSPTTFTTLIEESNKKIIPLKIQETCEQTINQQLQLQQQYQYQGNNNVNKTVARYSRPGRSPISLQRQTNARLTRHRLKIQQQRQEQLAHLALKERKQISQQNSNINSYRNYYNLVQHSSRSEDINHFNQVSRETGRKRTELLCLSKGRFDRNNCNNSSSSSIANTTTLHPSNVINAQQYVNRSTQLDQPKNNNLDQSNNCPQTFSRLHQPIRVDNSPIADSIAIEISDDQLACSSRQQQRTVNSSNCNSQKVSTSTGNVIVYNSFNMLRSGSSDFSLEGQQNQFSSSGGGSKRSSSGYNNNNINNNRENKRIESEDTQTICSSTGSTISLNRPFCKICHVSSTKNGDKLISPCKCSGTMQYIHCGCLLKWLEISNRTNEKPMSCELCAHEYTWHKKFNYKEARLPRCSFKDIICHLIFLAAIGVMFLSALAPIMYRKSHEQQDVTALKKLTSATELSSSQANYKPNTNNNNNQIDEQRPSRRYHMPSSSPTFHYNSHSGQSSQLAATSRLASDEKYILSCAASFFISFFLAIYVQTKARDTLYGLFIKFLAMNQTYYITEYDHGQLNSSTNSNSTANGNSNNISINNGGANDSSDIGSAIGGIPTNTSKLEQQQRHENQQHHNNDNHHHHHHHQQHQQNYRHHQQQQQYNGEESRFDRKNSEKS